MSIFIVLLTGAVALWVLTTMLEDLPRKKSRPGEATTVPR
jgi:hypothetical protein